MFAAASLTDAFNAVGTAFTAANPEAKATFSYDASSALVQQITQGAPADLFASADTANMDKLTAASLNGTEPVIFATNLLQIIVAAGQPEGDHRRRRPRQAGPQGGAVRHRRCRAGRTPSRSSTPPGSR